MSKTIDVSEIRPCTLCKRGVMHDNNIVFYKLSMVTCAADLSAIRQLHAMDLMFEGAVAIGRALSPTKSVGMEIGDQASHWLCMECVISKDVVLGQLLETN